MKKAFVFDIDGVLQRGKQVIPTARQALDTVREAQCPYVFATNSGGQLEQDKAKYLEGLLGFPVQGSEVVLSHTPVRDLVKEYQNKHVLVVGSHADVDMRSILHEYGFNLVSDVDTLLTAQPLMYPLVLDNSQPCPGRHHHRPEDDPAATSSKGITDPIECIMILHEPRDWNESLQIVLDVLQFHGSPPDCDLLARGEEHPFTSTNHIPLFVANPDFVYQAQYTVPRLTQGAFVECLSALYKRATGAELRTTFYGKPTRATYKYIENALAQAAGVTDTSTLQVYMIGDNPRSDIAGANSMGDNWTSVLVQTGCFKGDIDDNAREPDDTLRADVVCRDVLHAVQHALQK